jgi:hypothetical protein
MPKGREPRKTHKPNRGKITRECRKLLIHGELPNFLSSYKFLIGEPDERTLET